MPKILTALASPAAMKIAPLAISMSLAGCLTGCYEGLGNAPSADGGRGGGQSSSMGDGGHSGGGSGGQSTGGSGGGNTGGPCVPGQTKACYSGPPGTEGVGVCKHGVQICDAHGAFSGPCLGEVLPGVETCNTPFDDDCNGKTNEGGEGCACVPGEMEECYTGPAGTVGVGACAPGARVCNDQGTGFGPCEGDVTPEPETCADLVDNDCNGEVNEDGIDCVCTPNEAVNCYTGAQGTLGVGACKGGKKTCNAQGTAYGPCVGEVTASPETCNTPFDDDCNGHTNEGGVGCVCTPNEIVSCYTGPNGTLGVGACQGGTKQCNAQGTAYGPCVGEVTPVAETCNTPIDDDCNGQTNEGGVGCVCTPNAIVPCYSGPAATQGVGICKAGTATCNAQGTGMGACAGEVLPQIENCLNGVDDNCDGNTNEDCACVAGDVVSCYSGPPGTQGVGICAPGTRSCDVLTHTFGPCVGDVTPQPESCLDLVDNDCNGHVNEGGVGCVCTPNATTPCYSGPGGTEGVGLCKSGTHTCDAQGTGYGPCTGEVLPQPETCADLVDNDCNGQVNEGGPGCVCVPQTTRPCYSGPPGTAGVGACKSGVETCNAQGTVWGPCVGEVLPQAETCNTPVDDNCNGQLNEGGAGCVCTPNATRPCYSGAPGTEGVGACVGGTQACNGLGTAWGPCAGEVTPQPEDCATPADEDCDGATPVCPGALQWVKGFGSIVDDEGMAVAVDASDNVLLGGYMNGSIDFGCGLLTAGAADGALIVKLSPAGQCIWSKRFGVTANVNAVTSDAAGNVYIQGSFAQPLDFGGGPLNPAGNGDVFLAKLDANGNHVWSRSYGDAQSQISVAVAADPSGNLISYGYFKGTIDLGGGPLTSAGNNDIFVAKLSPTGAHIWSKRFGDSQNQVAKGLAVDASGNVLMIGNLGGTTDFGGGPLTSAGLADVFVTKLSPTGAHLWSKRYGDAQDQNGAGIATDASGNVLVTGYFNNTIDFGTGTLTSLAVADIYIAKLDPQGNTLWAQARGGPNNQSSLAIATDSTGAMAITGVLVGTADFGGGPLVNAGGGDIYVAKYDASGAHLWSKRFGDAAAQGGKALTVDSTGSVIVTGIIFGPTDFGSGVVPLVGGEDIFLAKFGP